MNIHLKVIPLNEELSRFQDHGLVLKQLLGAGPFLLVLLVI